MSLGGAGFRLYSACAPRDAREEMSVRDMMKEILANIQDRVGSNELQPDRLETEIGELRGEVQSGFAGTNERLNQLQRRFEIRTDAVD